MEEEKKSLELIHDKVDKISVQLENAKLADYFELMRNKKNLIWSIYSWGSKRFWYGCRFHHTRRYNNIFSKVFSITKPTDNWYLYRN